MNYRDQDDELERLRARRRPSGSARRYTPVRRREEFDDHSFDDDYYEEDYAYEEDLQEIPVEYESEEWEEDFSGHKGIRDSFSKRQSDQKRPRRASGAGKNGAAAASARTSLLRNSRDPGPSDGRRAGSRDSGHQKTGKKGTASGQQGSMAKRKKKHSWKYFVLLLLVLFIGYGAWLFLHRPTGNWTIAVFGVDSRDGSTKKALADVQMICNIDLSTGEIKLVSVYRDTYLKINSEGTYHKINEAYFKGGQKQAVDALEENLDIKIDDYATFNWKAVAEAINILGGIDLEITQAEFDYINGFITETVNSTGIASVHLTRPGMNHLDGVQAVAYCRLRLMDTDFQRTERQRKVVMLALDKAKQADVSTLTSLAGYLIQQISTSVGVDDVLPLVKDIEKFHIADTAGFPFSRKSMRVGKMDCVIPTTLESNVVLLHQFLYGEDVSYNPSSAVKKISAHISDETGLYEEGKAAPSGGLSGGASQEGQEGGGGNAPAPEPPPETAPVETLPVEESTEETAEEETTEEETEETTEAKTETREEEAGPGVSEKPTETPEKETEEKGPGTEGPGGVSPSTEAPARRPEPSSPGEGPGNAGVDSGGDESQAAGPGEGGPGV